MSATLWLDTEAEETIELGGTMQLYAAFAEMARAAGDAWQSDYPDLCGVVSQVEDQEDADPEWLAGVREQAAAFLRHYGDDLSDDAVGVLGQLADDDAEDFAEGDWSPYEGPRGGKGWKSKSGEIVYGDKPGTAPGWKPDAALPATTPAEPAKAEAKPGSASPAGTHSWPSRESLSRSPVKASERIGDDKHANEAKLLTLEDGTVGVYKPSSGETPLRDGVNVGTYYQREVAASDVAELLGFGDLVPPTVLRDSADGPGSMQAFVDGAAVAYTGNKTDGYTIDYDGDEDAGRAAAFDYLAGHLDRHAGNWLLKGGKLVLIDNGLAFPHSYHATDFFNMQFWSNALHRDLPVPDMEHLKESWPKVEAALVAAGLEDEAVALTKERFDALTSGKYKKVKDLPSPINPKWKLGRFVLMQEIANESPPDLVGGPGEQTKPEAK